MKETGNRTTIEKSKQTKIQFIEENNNIDRP